MKVLIIGRDARNDIVISDPYVSRRHVQLVIHDDNSIGIVDLNSKTGTYVNGKKISGEFFLEPNDVVKIGKTVLNWQDFVNNAGNIATQETEYEDDFEPYKKRSKLKKVLLFSIPVLLIIGVLAYFFRDKLFNNKEKEAAKQEKIFFKKTFGGKKRDIGVSVIKESDSSYVLLANTESKGEGKKNAWLIKTDNYGNTTWDGTFGGDSKYDATSFITTSDGGYLIAGKENQKLNLIKIDEDGEEEWNEKYGNTDDATTSLVEIDDNNYIIVYNTTVKNKKYSRILRIDESGKKKWEKAIDKKSENAVSSIIVNDEGDYLITGKIFSKDNSDILVVKLDENGKQIWKKTFGGKKDDFSNSIIATNDGDYIITAVTSSKGKGKTDAWIIKVDSEGNKVWDKTYGGKKNDALYSCVETDEGYVFAGETTKKQLDAWILSIDTDGEKMWSKTYGGNKKDAFHSVQITDDNNLIFCGTTVNGKNKEDVWLVKTDINGKMDSDKNDEDKKEDK